MKYGMAELSSKMTWQRYTSFPAEATLMTTPTCSFDEMA
jgi:hypothetical protein